MEVSDLFIDEEGDLLYGEIRVPSPFNDIEYYSEIVDGIYLLPFDFIVEEGGVSYRYLYTGIDRLDFLTYDIKRI